MVYLAIKYDNKEFNDLYTMQQFDTVREAVAIGMKFDKIGIEWRVLRELDVLYEVKQEQENG